MKVLEKIVIANLKLNRKRTIVTIIGIILSTALICAVSGMFTSLRASLLKNAINDTGYFHISLKTDSKTSANLTKNRDIKSIMNIHEIGYSKLVESQNEYKPYLRLLSIENPSDFLNLSFPLVEGRYPANELEVVISNTVITNGKVDLKIGDVIELNLGKRYACGNLIEVPNYLPSEFKYNDQEEIICHEENIQVDGTLNVKIVGIIERPNYYLEDYTEAGYSIITTNLKSDSMISHLVLKEPKDYLDTYENLNNMESSKELYLNNELLRWEVFKFSDDTMLMLISIISVIITIIMITSIFCIRNSFAISTLEKTRMFGMLASVGADKKQIKEIVLKEAFILGIIGIPLGILSGILADFILIIIMNKLTNDFIGTGFVFKISIIPIIISIILGSITIYLSAIRSAKKASKVSLVEAIRNNQDIKIKNKSLKTPWYIEKIFKTGGVIAYKNLKRSKKKYRTTVISLVVSILTFITMNSFINYGLSLSSLYYTDYGYDLIVYSKDKSDIDKILSIDGITNRSIIYDSYSLEITNLDKMSKFGYDHFIKDYSCSKYENSYICKDSESISMSIKILDDYSFKRYVTSNNLDYDKVYDKAILMDYYLVYQEDKIVNKRVYTYTKNNNIKGFINDKDEFTFSIFKVVDNNPIGLKNHNYYGGYLFLNEKYYEDLTKNSTTIALNTNDSNKLEEEIDKLNLDLNIDNIAKRVKEEKSMITLYSIFLYGFITVITLIGVTNIFNTISANMNLRQREFSILKSLGMTKKEFNRMINLETIFYSTKALFYGIILGIGGSYLVYKAFATNYDKGFNIPYKAILISIIFVILIVSIIMKYSINKINKQDIIETIRKENI